MKAEEYQISALYLRGLLAGLRHNAGNQYARLLKEAGLAQYIHNYPPPTLEKIATGEQVIRLHLVVREMMSPELYSLYTRNMGREFARTVSALPQLKEAIELLKKSAGSNIEIAYKAEQLLMQVKDQATTEQIECQMNPDGLGLTVIYRDCLQCKYSHCISDKSSCLGTIAFHKELLMQLTGRRYQVEEVRCGSVTGDNNCYILIH